MGDPKNSGRNTGQSGVSKVTGAQRKSLATSSVSAGYFWKSKLKNNSNKKLRFLWVKLKITYFVLAH